MIQPVLRKMALISASLMLFVGCGTQLPSVSSALSHPPLNAQAITPDTGSAQDSDLAKVNDVTGQGAFTTKYFLFPMNNLIQEQKAMNTTAKGRQWQSPPFNNVHDARSFIVNQQAGFHQTAGYASATYFKQPWNWFGTAEAE